MHLVTLNQFVVGVGEHLKLWHYGNVIIVVVTVKRLILLSRGSINASLPIVLKVYVRCDEKVR